MFSKWTQHLKETKDQEDFKESIYRARPVLDRLRAICDEFEKGLERSEQDPKIYNCYNYTHLQAHYNGFRQCLSQIRNLLDHREEENGRPIPTRPQRPTINRPEQELS